MGLDRHCSSDSTEIVYCRCIWVDGSIIPFLDCELLQARTEHDGAVGLHEEANSGAGCGSCGYSGTKDEGNWTSNTEQSAGNERKCQDGC